VSGSRISRYDRKIGVVNGLTLALLALAEMLGVTQLIEDELA
jgi:hypothetical protein